MYSRKAPTCMNPSWYRWLAHLTLTQETGVRVPVTELFAFQGYFLHCNLLLENMG